MEPAGFKLDEGIPIIESLLCDSRSLAQTGDGALATWCYTQRERRKKGRLSKERIRVLDEIGFVWSQDLNGGWMKNYEALKIFLDKQQRFPKSAEGCLGEWCSTQRKMRKQGKLSPDRQTLLDRIGFVWSVEQVWRSYLEQLHQFHVQMDGGLDVVKGRWGVGVRFKDGIIEEEACRIKNRPIGTNRIYILERRQVIQKKWKYSHFIRNNRVSAALLSQFKVHYDLEYNIPNRFSY